MVIILERDGWMVRPEVSFSEFGERGSIDLLAFHAATGALLLIEVKSAIPDMQGMLMALDRKARLAPRMAERQGWRVMTVSRLLVVPNDGTVRRRVTEHAATL